LTELSDIRDEDLAHLHVHTDYSLLDGSIRVKEAISRAKELGHSAVAITDHGNLFHAIEFYDYANKDGIKPIIGSEIFHSGSEATAAYSKSVSHPYPKTGAFHLVLLSQNLKGYKNLIKIVSSSFLAEKQQDVPVTQDDTLDEWSSDIIALSSCHRGEFAYLVAAIRDVTEEGPLNFDSTEENAELACAALKIHVESMKRRFGGGNYFVELIDNNIDAQKKLLPDLVAAAKHYELPLIASADAHYLTEDRLQAHSILMGIKHGLTMTKLRGRLKNARFHMLDNDEMRSVYGEWPEALANQKVIVDRCNVEFNFGEYFLPQYDTGREESADDALRRISYEMLEKRFIHLRKLYGATFNEQSETDYKKRLEYELDVICSMGFPGYFLIVQDFINWAIEQDIPVGPGRGSGAGSLVAYALNITDLDPIPYNLLFERFLNPERISMPDFDVDFCQERRGEVIQYVNDHYGSENVAQITTFGKMNAKGVIRDVGRVLELGYGRVDGIAKLIPDDIGITLDEAMEVEPRIGEMARNDDLVADLLMYAKQLEGLSRHTSVHAAGLVISDGLMTNYVPVYTAENSGLITMFDMKRVEQTGLVKFDFLGLKTLTVIQRAERMIQAQLDKEFDIRFIPIDDKKVFSEVSAGNAVGIFQLESSGMRNLNLKLQPSCFEDIIAVVALFRPGPLGSGMVETFIECKHGRQEIVYPHPLLEKTLEETYGTILYQEQVMKIAQILAKYSLGEADMLRRAMGKKIKAEMDKQKNRFMEGALENNIDEKKASDIFDLMAEFANYGFNKSHSAAYGYVSYQTAYLKVHYTEQFMAAIMTCDLDNTSKIVRYVEECKRLKLKILPPNINRSDLAFDVPAKRTVGFGLEAIKGIGGQAIEPIVTERKANGPFKSLSELAQRVNLKKVGKKTLEILIQVGALDEFELSRTKLLSVVKELVKLSENLHTAKTSGQGGLFDADPEDDDALGELTWVLKPQDKRIGAVDPTWLDKEKKLLGVFMTGHPLTFHQEDMKALGGIQATDMATYVGKSKVPVIAVLGAMNERFTKAGKRMANLRLETPKLNIEAVMFEEEIPEEFPPSGALVFCECTIRKRFDSDELNVRVEKIEILEDRRDEWITKASIRLKLNGALKSQEASNDALVPLKNLVDKNPGDVPIRFILDYEDEACDIVVNVPQKISLSNEFLYGMENLSFESHKIYFNR
jgi:DNA polymerase III subunit alpha